MSYKQEFYKNRITDLCNSYKALASLSMLALAEKNIKQVIKLHNGLNDLFNDIVKFITLLNDKEILKSVKELEIDNLPDYLSSLKTVFSYNKILSLNYTETEIDDIQDKILLNKMSVEFNHAEEIPYLNIARVLYEQGKYAEAVELCEFIKTISDTAPVWNLLGDIYRAVKRYGQCINAYRIYLELNEDDEEVANKLAEVYEEALT